MALVVFLRGVNVGGHKTFRPSALAKILRDYDVVNIGAAGTFIVRKPGPRATFRDELKRNLPFETEIIFCDGSNLMQLQRENPFGSGSCSPDIVRFVSILARAGGLRRSLPVAFPDEGDWLVRIIGSRDSFVFGEYRRHMKTIGYLGQIDKLFSCPVTTRNWNTILTVLQLLDADRDRKPADRGR